MYLFLSPQIKTRSKLKPPKHKLQYTDLHKQDIQLPFCNTESTEHPSQNSIFNVHKMKKQDVRARFRQQPQWDQYGGHLCFLSSWSNNASLWASETVLCAPVQVICVLVLASELSHSNGLNKWNTIGTSPTRHGPREGSATVALQLHKQRNLAKCFLLENHNVE